MTPVERRDPPVAGDERATLTAFLDYHRATLRWKCSGLSPDQLAERVGASALTLGGLLLDLAIVEDSWFTHRFAGRALPTEWADVDRAAGHDWELALARTKTPDELLARYDAACARSRAVTDAAGSLDQLSAVADPHTGEPFSLRWVLLHLVEETARHNGHADLLREQVDGLVGE